MVSVFFKQTIAFIVVLALFFPYLSKVVRLASRTWDERKYLDSKRVKQVVFMVPLLLFFAFIGVYFGVLALLDILVFS